MTDKKESARKSALWKLDKWMKFISYITTILLLIITIWAGVNQHRFSEVIKEREKINQRYAELVDQMEKYDDELNRKLQGLLDRFGRHLDHMKHDLN
jgi:hypothetical protein